MFKTIKKEIETSITEKKSKFICHIYCHGLTIWPACFQVYRRTLGPPPQRRIGLGVSPGPPQPGRTAPLPRGRSRSPAPLPPPPLPLSLPPAHPGPLPAP